MRQLDGARTFGVEQDTLLHEEDAHNLLQLGPIDINLLEYGHTTVTGEADLLEHIVVEERVDGEHEHVLNRRHCLG